MKKAIILCSGGIDSVVTAHYVKRKLKYDKITLLFFDYGQKSLLAERKYSKKCAKELHGDFKEIKLNELKKISTSLINVKGKIVRLERKDLKDTKKESKKWYVPCRNLIFLSYALAYGEKEFVKSKRTSDIFVGFKNDGLESFPDTTKEFVALINKISLESSEVKSRIIAPLIKKDKEDIILLGKELCVDFKNTFSCYIGKNIHCGECLACMLRKEGFHWAGIKDETKYED